MLNKQLSNQHDKAKKYSEMLSHRLKVTYNCMGEKCVERIALTNVGKGYRNDRTIRWKNRKDDSASFDLSRRQQRSSFVSRKRVTRILRQVLAGKLSRNSLMNSASIKEQTSTTFMDILRLYCQTSYGATAVSSGKQLELINVIRKVSPHSSFVQVMERFLNIQGTVPYASDLVDIYCLLWSRLLIQDLIKVVTPDSIIMAKPCDIAHSFQEALVGRGIRLSPRRISSVIACMSLLPKSNTHKGGDDCVNLDDAILSMLNMLEKFDEEAKHASIVIFGSGVLPESLLRASARDIKTTNTVPGLLERKTFLHEASCALDQLKKLLDALVVQDLDRFGFVPHDAFCEKLSSWYSAVLPDTSQSEFEKLSHLCLCLFTSEESVGVDYIEFFALLHSFFLEQVNIPSITALLCTLSAPHRGFEVKYHNNIVQYVDYVRLDAAQAVMSPPTCSVVSQCNVPNKFVLGGVSGKIKTRLERPNLLVGRTLSLITEIGDLHGIEMREKRSIAFRRHINYELPS